jgi:hypothetical protein
MSVIICPGVHSPELTQAFLTGIGKTLELQKIRIFPAEQLPPYSPLHLLNFLGVPQLDGVAQRTVATGSQLQHCPWEPLLFIGFSAGVVGAMGAAQIFQSLGGQVKAFIAFDGWGVPLAGNFPIHRISHDRFTDWSSPLWGRNDSSFYADPGVAHLELWRSPQTAQGYAIEGDKRYPATAAQFLQHLLIQHQEAKIRR